MVQSLAPLSEVSSQNFDVQVLRSSGPVLVDCWATWCTTCKALEPKLAEIAAEMGSRASVVKLSVETSPDVAARYGVKGLPAILFFKDGELRNQLNGNHSKESIRSSLESLL